MELLLEIVEGEGAGRQVEIAQSVELGRDPEVTLVLDDEEVSRHHARIDAEDGEVTLYDLESTNGTYVNDQPVSGSRRLAAGDRIRLGLTVLELRTREQVAAQPSAVGPAPDITQLGQGVLQPAATDELSPVEQTDSSVPGFLVEESEPAFVPKGVAEGGGAGDSAGDREPPQNADALARLIDTRVKRQTNVAAFAVLAIAGLAVLVFFGVR